MSPRRHCWRKERPRSGAFVGGFVVARSLTSLAPGYLVGLCSQVPDLFLLMLGCGPHHGLCGPSAAPGAAYAIARVAQRVPVAKATGVEQTRS